MDTAILEELKGIRAVLERSEADGKERAARLEERATTSEASLARSEEALQERLARERELHTYMLAYYEANPWKRLARWIWPL